MMYAYSPSLVIVLVVLNTIIVAIEFVVCWRQENYRRLLLWVCMAALAAVIAILVVAIIMIVFGVSVTN